MEKTESYYFFKFLNLCKRRLSYEHHNRFLNVCKEENMVAKGLRLNKTVNIAVISGCFEEDWRSVLVDASKKLQDVLVRETLNVERRITAEISEIKRFITDRYGEEILNEMVRKISVICDKLNDALLERKRNKLTVLREENERAETRESSGVGDWDVKDDDRGGRNQTESGFTLEQIEDFISDIRQQVSRRDYERHENSEVEVEDLISEENLGGVNPLPVDCPILLVDLRDVNSDLDSVIQEARDGSDMRHRIVYNDIRTFGEESAASCTEIREENIRPPVRGNGLDTGAGLDTGDRIVVNLSKRHLTEAEISLLSKGLKFCPTPEGIDVYNVRKDIRDYIRRIRLREYFYCEDGVDGDFSEMPALRTKSTWCPERNREMAIEAYVEALERTILSHDLTVKCQRNLTQDEQRALENLRNYDDIIIKQADKGSAVVVMDREAYINEAVGQLNDSEVYRLLDGDPTRDMVEKINEKIRESWEKGNIDDKTRDYLMVTEDVKPGRFYLLPKIHKRGCPGRPVISGSGTPTENISAFVDQKVRPLVPEIESYIKDTNDFLHKLEQIGELPEGAILCTIDVVGLYPHIPHNEGLEALKEALSTLDGQVDSEQRGSLNEDVLSFAELVLKNNNFEFNGKHYLQKRGTAIGTRMAPSYANIFMDRLERRLIQDAEVKPHIWWRYIDDIFIVWTEGKEKLEEFIDYLNNAHDTIKFTSRWSRDEIEFLDVRVINESGKLETDVYVKPTDSHQYLHYSSCHPGSCKSSIPYAQAMRLRRICSKASFFEKRARDLVLYLTKRGYNKRYVESQIQRVRSKTREEVLTGNHQTRKTKTPFVVTYHPGLPNLSRILRDLHPVLESSDRCKKAIREVPLVAFRRPKSLGDYLVRARVNGHDRGDNRRGTCKCTSSRCEVCKYLNENSRFKSSHDDKSYSINYNLNCNSSYVVYLITCKKCSLQYVGSTTTKFRLRFNNHKSRIRRHRMLTQAEKRADDLLYRHFCGEEHNGLSDVEIQLIDRVNGEQQLREKEGQWAYKLNTLDPNGLNDNDFFFVQNRRSRRM